MKLSKNIWKECAEYCEKRHYELILLKWEKYLVLLLIGTNVLLERLGMADEVKFLFPNDSLMIGFISASFFTSTPVPYRYSRQRNLLESFGGTFKTTTYLASIIMFGCMVEDAFCGKGLYIYGELVVAGITLYQLFQVRRELRNTEV